MESELIPKMLMEINPMVEASVVKNKNIDEISEINLEKNQTEINLTAATVQETELSKLSNLEEDSIDIISKIKEVVTEEVNQNDFEMASDHEHSVRAEFSKFLEMTKEELIHRMEDLTVHIQQDEEVLNSGRLKVFELDELIEYLKQKTEIAAKSVQDLSNDFQQIQSSISQREKEFKEHYEKRNNNFNNLSKEYEKRKLEYTLKLNENSKILESKQNTLKLTQNEKEKLYKLICDLRENYGFLVEKKTQLAQNLNEIKAGLFEGFAEKNNKKQTIINELKQIRSHIEGLRQRKEELVGKQIETKKNKLEAEESLSILHKKRNELSCKSIEYTKKIEEFQIKIKKIEKNQAQFNSENILAEKESEIQKCKIEKNILEEEYKSNLKKLELCEESLIEISLAKQEIFNCIDNNKITINNQQKTLQQLQEDLERKLVELNIFRDQYEINNLNKKCLSDEISKLEKDSQDRLAEKIAQSENCNSESKKLLHSIEQLKIEEQAKCTLLEDELKRSSDALKSKEEDVSNINKKIENRKLALYTQQLELNQLKMKARNTGKFRVVYKSRRADCSKTPPPSKRVRFNEILDIKPGTDSSNVDSQSQEL